LQSVNGVKLHDQSGIVKT
jgi:hypothetical protein